MSGKDEGGGEKLGGAGHSPNRQNEARREYQEDDDQVAVLGKGSRVGPDPIHPVAGGDAEGRHDE
jgi:hypothetical protein